MLVGTAQKMKFSIKDFFGKCDQIHKKLRIWSHLLKKSLMENFIFCAVWAIRNEFYTKPFICQSSYLSLQCIMSQNGQTLFKNLAANALHYALKGSRCPSKVFFKSLINHDR